MRRVAFIGHGNVATRMAARLEQLGIEVAGFYHRSGSPVSQLNAEEVDAVIIAVTDDAIASVLRQVHPSAQTLWLHTSGSVGIDVFPPELFPRHGVLYPIQTMLKERNLDWKDVPLFIEGDDPEIGRLARLMSPKVAPLDSLSRRRLHAAAVVGCNLVMYLWALSADIMQRAGLDFHLLAPLLEMTLSRALSGSPAHALTGPARRGDLNTMRKHLEALPPDAAEVYRLLSQKILNIHHPDLEL